MRAGAQKDPGELIRYGLTECDLVIANIVMGRRSANGNTRQNRAHFDRQRLDMCEALAALRRGAFDECMAALARFNDREDRYKEGRKEK